MPHYTVLKATNKLPPVRSAMRDNNNIVNNNHIDVINIYHHNESTFDTFLIRIGKISTYCAKILMGHLCTCR